MFVLNSDISVGGFRFTGVHEVSIKRSTRSIVATATVSLPAKASVSENGTKSAERINTSSKFKQGDVVTISLGYNGALVEEFRGFVKEIVTGMPLKIVCEGYSWLLRNNKISIDRIKTLKDLVATAVSNLPNGMIIETVCNEDIELINIVPKSSSGFDLLSAVQAATDNTISMFFTPSGKLWCGTLHGAVAANVFQDVKKVIAFRLGFNALQHAALKPGPSTATVSSVKYSRKRNNGTTITYTAGKEDASKASYEKTLNQVATTEGLKLLAEEQLSTLKTPRLEGQFTAFLQPCVAPGNAVYIEGTGDFTAGTYLVESTEVTFGLSGARRKIELGIMLKPS